MRRLRLLFLLLCGLLLLAGCGGASSLMLRGYLNDNREQLDIPVDAGGAPVRFDVAPGTPAQTIGTMLLQAGLIHDDLLFEAYVRTNDLATSLEAGTFMLCPCMSMAEIVQELQHGRAEGIVVAVREGWRIEQVADYLTTANVFSDTVAGISPQAAIYEQMALSGDFGGTIDPARFPFLQERPEGASLEGYLFPDSYELNRDAPSGAALVALQLDAFAAKALPLYEEARAAGTTTLTLHQVLTLAAIVEREAVVPAERPAIAGVYLNRLANNIRLDADPTVQYAMGYQPEANQWWKTPVTLEEYSGVLSPYNTYLNAGLPPGPIAAPGLSSIEAVLAPEQHQFLYFVAVPDGTGAHVFAETYDEHVANVARYLSGGQ